MLCLYYSKSILCLYNSQSYGPMEHSCNDVIKSDCDTVTYVYAKAAGIFLCSVIRAGA